MVDAMLEFLRSRSSLQPTNRVHIKKVVYALCNQMGTIVMMAENGRMVRKSNVLNQLDIRVTSPLDYLANFANEPYVSLSMTGTDTILFLMYCHRPCEKLKSSCREVVLLGAVAIVFNHYRKETEDAAEEHRRKCACGHLCHTRPATLTLSPGDRIVLNNGAFYLRACAEQHCLYMNKEQFLTQVTFTSSRPGVAESAMAFVKSLPDAQPSII